MKRFGLILTLLLAAGAFAGAAPQVLIVAGRTMMPARYCSESYGAQVVYTQRTKEISLSLDGSSVRLTIGERRCWYGSEVVMLDTAPFVYMNVVYVPVIVVGRALRADVRWDGPARQVTIIRAGKKLVMVGKPWTPPGLAKKGGLPPGQAKKLAVGSAHGKPGHAQGNPKASHDNKPDRGKDDGDASKHQEKGHGKGHK